jgi:tRNA-dihydrouridine synthase B
MAGKYNLGDIELKNRIFLAPMHQINDVAFRLLAKKAGASLTYTGLINPQTKEELELKDKPALQFAANSTIGIKEFIEKYDKEVSLYDLNLGCPSPHAKQSKFGYFMTSNLKLIEEILKEIKRYTKKPLTLKIRKMPLPQTKAIINLAEKYCEAIGVHPRTQVQGYSGIPDLEFARTVKSLTKIAVIYSGNINNKEEAKNMLKEFDFIMIGRASMGNPSIFSDLTNKKIEKRISFEDWLNLAKKEIKKLEFQQIKFQAMNFTKGFEGATTFRHKLGLTKNEKEILEVIKEIPAH